MPLPVYPNCEPPNPPTDECAVTVSAASPSSGHLGTIEIDPYTLLTLPIRFCLPDGLSLTPDLQPNP